MIGNIFIIMAVLGTIYNFSLIRQNKIHAKIRFSYAISSFAFLLVLYFIYMSLTGINFKSLLLLLAGISFFISSFLSEGLGQNGIVYYLPSNLLARISRLKDIQVKKIDGYKDDKINLEFEVDGKKLKQTYGIEDRAYIEKLFYDREVYESVSKDS